MPARRARVFQTKQQELHQEQEKKFEDACLTLRAAASPNVHAVAHEHGISYHTLRRRFLHLTKPHRIAHASQQLLSPEQESVLLDWIKHLSASGHPLSKRTIRIKAMVLVGTKPSEKWTRGFLARHPQIGLGKPSSLDPQRCQNFNRTVVENHFTLLKRIIEEKAIPWENAYNMDEKGCQRGGGRKTSPEKYFVPRGRYPKYKARSGNLELVTVIECVCADGTDITPGFVFSGKKYHKNWFKEHPDISYVSDHIWRRAVTDLINSDFCFSVATSPNGWTDDFICTNWFEKSFIPQTKSRNQSGKPILLICDGHGSHVTKRMRELAVQNNIELFCLPPHTTHNLQPLDVGVFGPLQRAWQKRCDDVFDETGQEIPREDFVNQYMAARAQAFKVETITAAWKNSGIRPLNPHIFSDQDFAPSMSSSTAAHAPASYPVQPHELTLYGNVLSRMGPGTSSNDLLQANDSETETSGMSEGSRSDSDASAAADSDSEFDLDMDQSGDEHGGHYSRSDDSEPLSNLSYPQHMPSSDSRPLTASASGTPIDSESEMDSKDSKIAMLEAKVQSLESELLTTRAHCALALSEMGSMKKRMNTKKTKSRAVTINARWLTSAEGLQACEAQDLERERKKQKQAEVAARKSAKEIARFTRQAAQVSDSHTVRFTGALSSKGKEDLLDIALQLKVETSGTKADLFRRIRAFFEANPALKQDARFTGLFRGRARAQKHSVDPSANHDDENENIPLLADEGHAAVFSPSYHSFIRSPHDSNSTHGLSFAFSSSSGHDATYTNASPGPSTSFTPYPHSTNWF